MPVILPLGREKAWLRPDPTGMFMFPRISPELLTSHPVTPKMNRATFNEPAAIATLSRVLSLQCSREFFLQSSCAPPLCCCSSRFPSQKLRRIHSEGRQPRNSVGIYNHNRDLPWLASPLYRSPTCPEPYASPNVPFMTCQQFHFPPRRSRCGYCGCPVHAGRVRLSKALVEKMGSAQRYAIGID